MQDIIQLYDPELDNLEIVETRLKDYFLTKVNESVKQIHHALEITQTDKQVEIKHGIRILQKVITDSIKHKPSGLPWDQ